MRPGIGRGARVPATLLLSGLLGMAFVSGCSSSGSSAGTSTSAGTSASGTAAASPFVIAESLDFSGPGKAYGIGESLGLQVAAAELNKSGGILGHKIVIKEVNDESNPTQGVSGLQQLLSSGVTPNLVWAGSNSTVTQAELPVLMTHKIISFDATSASNLNNPSMYPYYFATNQTVTSSVPAFVTIAKQQGWKKVAMIYGNDVSGQASEQAYQSALSAANIKLVSTSYSDTALSMTPELDSLRSQNPNALIVSATTGVAMLPWLLFALPAGVLVDRVDRRRLMVAVDWARAAGMGLLAVAIVGGWSSIVLLDLVLFLINTGETAFEPAAQSMVPAVVSRDQLERANGWLVGGLTVGSIK